MNFRKGYWTLLPSVIFVSTNLCAQQKDTSCANGSSFHLLEKTDTFYSDSLSLQVKDSVDKKQKDRYRTAAILSAVLPGAGQVYNKKYWKLPLVYTGLGIPAYFYFSSKTIYQQTQYALDVTINGDSAAKVQPYLQPFVRSDDVNGLITARDEARNNEDYAVLFFILFYGLNIVDATVDAHLKDFNISSNLSFQIKPMINPALHPVQDLLLHLMSTNKVSRLCLTVDHKKTKTPNERS